MGTLNRIFVMFVLLTLVFYANCHIKVTLMKDCTLCLSNLVVTAGGWLVG